MDAAFLHDRPRATTDDPTTPATLGYMMRDYVAHLKHHLNQID